MEVIHTVEWMKQVAREARADRQALGFVPTMGALHAGHLALVEQARRESSPVVVSVFINPRQFGPREDYTKYPRTLEADSRLLEKAGVDFLFAPSAEQMYPPGFRTEVSVAELGDRLEGGVRPGHFRGVTTVVLKLFEIVVPQRTYFGRKDAQQARIVTQMAGDLALDCEVIVCPIVREPDGLAMSSRNVYLSAEERRAATILFRTLQEACQAVNAGERNSQRLITLMRGMLATESVAIPDYVELVNADTFEPTARLQGTCYALLAARLGQTRLIDNLLIEAGATQATCSL